MHGLIIGYVGSKSKYCEIGILSIYVAPSPEPFPVYVAIMASCFVSQVGRFSKIAFKLGFWVVPHLLLRHNLESHNPQNKRDQNPPAPFELS